MDRWIKQRVWFTTKETRRTRYSPKHKQSNYEADRGWDRLWAREAAYIERTRQQRRSA